MAEPSTSQPVGDANPNDAIQGPQLSEQSQTETDQEATTGDDDFAPPPPQRQLTIDDPNVHSCFICLLNSNETPDAIWVFPCPCTLEAHEDCLLRWVAESEASSGKKKLRCPACNSRIQIVEPTDALLQLRERIHKTYSRIAPVGLLSTVLGCGIVGSAYYGYMAMSVFAGTLQTLQWLDPFNFERRRVGRVGLSHIYAVYFKLLLLNLIGPGLVLNRALPSLGSLLLMPASVLYGTVLVAQDRLPDWPPSPAWVLTLMPLVSLSYHSLWYEIFGPLNKRLNRALRGRPVVEEAQAADGEHGANPADAPEDDDADRGGALGAAWRAGNGLLNLFGEDNLVLEVDVEVNDVDLGGQDPAAAQQAELEAAADRLRNRLQEIEAEEQAEEAAAVGQEGTEEVGADQVEPAPPPPDIQVIVQDQPAGAAAAIDAVAEQQPPPAENNRDDRPSTITDVVNAMASALLFPAVAAGIGEVMRRTLPARWTAGPLGRRPTGLLQEQWGRSLVGGCLFVVVKDMFQLYTKYRRVQVRQHRKIKNVNRRRNNGTDTTSA